VTNPGTVTTSEVVAIIRKVLNLDRDFQFFRDESEFMTIAAKTPRSNCVLDTTKLTDAGISLTPVQEAVEKSLRYWT
jgi:dTDP-4-dehydrorhamnose reductase